MGNWGKTPVKTNLVSMKKKSRRALTDCEHNQFMKDFYILSLLQTGVDEPIPIPTWN